MKYLHKRLSDIEGIREEGIEFHSKGRKKLKEADNLTIENNSKTSATIQAERQVTAHRLKLLTEKHCSDLQKEREEMDAVLALKDFRHKQEVDSKIKSKRKCEAKSTKVISNLTGQLADKEDEIRRISNCLEMRDKEVNELNDTIKAVQEEKDELRVELKDVKSQAAIDRGKHRSEAWNRCHQN